MTDMIDSGALTFHVHALPLPERGAEFLGPGRKPSLYVFGCKCLMLILI